MRIASACVAIALFCGSAQAYTITFDSLEAMGAGTTTVGINYTEGDFIIEQGLGEAFPLSSFQQSESRYTGSAALFNDTIDGSLFLSSTTGDPFSISSIDLSELNSDGSVSVSFVGDVLGGGSVSQTFVTDGTFGMETFNFAGFTELTQLSWTQASPFHQFDNLVLNVEMEPIPLPAPALMLGGALGLLVVSRRRKRKA